MSKKLTTPTERRRWPRLPDSRGWAEVDRKLHAEVGEPVQPGESRPAGQAAPEPNGHDGPGLLLDGLATLPEKAILDEMRLAHLLGCTTRTVRAMVGRYELPPAIKIRGRACWFAGKVLEHFEAEAERKARQAERSARKFREIT